jgi:hypothetical protein
MGQQRAPEMRPLGSSGWLVCKNASWTSQNRAGRSEITKTHICPTFSFSGAVTQKKIVLATTKSTFMKRVTLFAPSLIKWVRICPWHIDPTMFYISYDVRCICRIFQHNYRQNNGGETKINTWSAAFILTRMNKSLHPGLPTSNLAQPSQIRSRWDIC